MREASTGSLLVSVNPKNSQKKREDADRICTTAGFTSLIIPGRINAVHLHFVCPNVHYKLYHTLRHTLLLIHALTLLSTHTKLGGVGLHTQDTGMYVIPKTLMRHFLECKVLTESGVSLKVLTSLRCPLCSPDRLVGIGEKEQQWIRHGGGQRGGVVGGAYF